MTNEFLKVKSEVEEDGPCRTPTILMLVHQLQSALRGLEIALHGGPMVEEEELKEYMSLPSQLALDEITAGLRGEISRVDELRSVAAEIVDRLS